MGSDVGSDVGTDVGSDVGSEADLVEVDVLRLEFSVVEVLRHVANDAVEPEQHRQADVEAHLNGKGAQHSG